jgi:hypothetical protein
VGVKRPGRKLNQSPPPSAEVEMVKLYYSSPIRLHGMLLNPLQTEFLLNNIQEFSSYLTGNTLPLRYKDRPANAV